MPSPLIYLTEGSRIAFSSLKNRFSPKQYEGDAAEICRQIVKGCWNGRFFQTSTKEGNFPQFWTRDFGFCTAALLKLGYKEEIQATLRYALHRFKRARKVTTTITPQGKPYDFPTIAADSLPWFMHCLKLARFPYQDHRAFLNQEIQKYYQELLDHNTGLIRPELEMSSLKDFAIRKSSCYDNCMAGMLAQDLKSMKLVNPFAAHHYPELLLRHFWNGRCFADDLQKKAYVAGDANIFPFLSGLIKDEGKLRSCIQAMQEAELDQPFPLKYTAKKNAAEFRWQEKVALSNYEGNALWMHLGPLYVKLVKAIDVEKAEKYRQAYQKLIEQHQNFYEVFTPDGKLYRSWYYAASPGMLWAANYLTL